MVKMIVKVSSINAVYNYDMDLIWNYELDCEYTEKYHFTEPDYNKMLRFIRETRKECNDHDIIFIAEFI